MLVPYNRHLLVEPIKTEDRDDAVVLIPASSVKLSPWSLVKLLATAPDCEKFNGEVGCTLVVNTGMIEEIEVCQNKFNLILENHVIGLYYEDGTEEK